MTTLAPPDGPDVVYEFFAPFAHVEGKVEWCRIRSPTHGVFDAFIVLGASTSVAATVYVSSESGARFMRERYPECETFRVDAKALFVEERDEGRTVVGGLRAAEGPVRAAEMRLAAAPGIPRQVPYAVDPVWGSRFRCDGVDLVLDGEAFGEIVFADGRVEPFDGAPCFVTLGSFGRIAPR